MQQQDADYGWVITRDYLQDPLDVEDSRYPSAVGIAGPHNISDAIKARLDAGEGATFRMLDDDGTPYFKGRLIHPDKHSFDPLDDFGMPDSGCTSIEFLVGRGHWQAL